MYVGLYALLVGLIHLAKVFFSCLLAIASVWVAAAPLSVAVVVAAPTVVVYSRFVWALSD